MTRNAKMTNPKPVVMMGYTRSRGRSLVVDGYPLAAIVDDFRDRPYIKPYGQYGLHAVTLRAIADFLDQIEEDEDADPKPVVTMDGKTVPCRAALNLVGEHFPCDWPTDEIGRHDGWAHANKEAQAVWSSDEGADLLSQVTE